MAKIKNQLMNKLRNKKNMVNNAAIENLKAKMKQQMDNDEYAEAISTMAEIAEHKKMDAETMYMGAYCYFMVGDNNRAATWVNNALAYNADNVKARILLARICFVEDRTDDGLAVIDSMLVDYSDRIDADDKIALDEMLDYYKYNDSEAIREGYPAIAKFLGMEPKENVNNTAGIKTEQPADEDGETINRAKAAVAKLKAMLKKAKEENTSSMEERTDDEQHATEVAEECAAQQENKDAHIDSDDANEEVDVVKIEESILTQSVSLREKIRMLNAFASGCYLSGNYQDAFDLLSKALELDDKDPFILKNIAYVCAAAGEKEQALGFVANLPMIDFGVIDAIHNK